MIAVHAACGNCGEWSQLALLESLPFVLVDYAEHCRHQHPGTIHTPVVTILRSEP